MLTLGVDTSGPIGGVALYEENDIAVFRTMDAPLSHAECLFSMIEEILEAREVSTDMLGMLSVNRGPGSFTGLRIGLSAVKGLGQALEIPIVGVDAMDVHRLRAQGAPRVCTVVASRRNLYYARWLGHRQLGDQSRILREEELLRLLDGDTRPICVVGSGTDRLKGVLHTRSHVRVLPELSGGEFALAVAKWGAQQIGEDQLYAVEPLYVEPLLVGG